MKILLILLLFPLFAFAFSPLPVTPFPVIGFKELPFFDNNQKVNRTVLVWYPVLANTVGHASPDPWDTFNIAVDGPVAETFGKMPVIVISHGYRANPHTMSWLIRELVFNGFIVLAIEHRDVIDGKMHANHWQRAQDVSKIIDQFSGSEISKFADLNKIGIAGFSLGGTTAIWTSGGRSTNLDTLMPDPKFAAIKDFLHVDEALITLNKEMAMKDWRDSRVKAAFVMAPAWAWLFDESSLKNISIPVYLIAAEADATLVTKNNAGLFARKIPDAIFQTIPGKANHYIFLSSLSDAQRKKADPFNSLSFLFEDDVTVDRGWIQSEVGEEAVRFFKSTL